MCAMPESPSSGLLSSINKISKNALDLYPLSSQATIKLINFSENITYLVEDAEKNKRMILRISRPGYHTKEELDSELIWMDMLKRNAHIAMPAPIAGKDGRFVQTLFTEQSMQVYQCVLFTFLEGDSPDEQDNLPPLFQKVGEVTAELHNQSQYSAETRCLQRPVWDYDTTIGNNPQWGRWRDGLAVTPEQTALFQQVSDIISERLNRFGKGPERFGLIHADLRLVNLLVKGEELKIIDFDDCGYSWFLYDLASSLSFIEHRDDVPELIEAWLTGYKKSRSISHEEEAEIPTFIMLRRLLLLAWISSHSDTETAKQMGAAFTSQTEKLARKYLSEFN